MTQRTKKKDIETEKQNKKNRGKTGKDYRRNRGKEVTRFKKKGVIVVRGIVDRENIEEWIAIQTV